ncbi:uncharacterized protein F5891DRAFT_1124102 [Suillus fuscotomentosus]|uniref:Uncharacterized protein n=1 Tax=Suillus fuscotomentosus TaxID=1912939 RepID=A0AAD4HVM0_9AGAM|nr:uncharacterized protein F5891DRAFT_1124102 [Suillus fuscotomentosus]KAG1908249.1 hypothetical protein F5891DRAFT_1124102 [Suillus fuscotomentosus]
MVPGIQTLLGANPSADSITVFLKDLVQHSNTSLTVPDVKSYSDAVYFNYYPLGISFLFIPQNWLEDLQVDSLVLDSINIYNAPKHKATTTKTTTSISIEISLTSNGKDFVSCLGEPDRKGGGAGPSSGSIGIWCEWLKHGIMVEFGGDEARGPQAWERGKDAIWRVITVFPPKQE